MAGILLSMITQHYPCTYAIQEFSNCYMHTDKWTDVKMPHNEV